MSPASPPGLCTLETADRNHLQALINEHGLAGATKLLRVSRGVIASAVAGLNVRRASRALLVDALARQRRNGATK